MRNLLNSLYLIFSSVVIEWCAEILSAAPDVLFWFQILVNKVIQSITLVVIRVRAAKEREKVLLRSQLVIFGMTQHGLHRVILLEEFAAIWLWHELPKALSKVMHHGFMSLFK